MKQSCILNLGQGDEFQDINYQLWKVKIFFETYSLKSNSYFLGTIMYNVPYGFVFIFHANQSQIYSVEELEGECS